MVNPRFVIQALALWILVSFGIHVLENIWWTIALFHSGILTCLFIHRKRFKPVVLFKGWHWGWAVLNVLIGIVCGTIIYFAWDIFGISGDALKTLGFGNRKWLLMIYFSTINPMLEELFWRALPPVLPPEEAMRHTEKNAWLTASDIAFAGYHVIVVSGFAGILFCTISFIGLLFGAVMWRRLYHTLNGLLVPLLTHGLIDFFLIGIAIAHVHP